jgi:hypothetical protein
MPQENFCIPENHHSATSSAGDQPSSVPRGRIRLTEDEAALSYAVIRGAHQAALAAYFPAREVGDPEAAAIRRRARVLERITKRYLALAAEMDWRLPER